MKFQGAKIQREQSCLKCDCKLCPQDLTEGYSGLHNNDDNNNDNDNDNSNEQWFR